jgi:hypothetical protein
MSNNTALDLIKGALRRINSYQSGETIAPQDTQDCLDTLNDMLDMWSTDKLSVYGSNENILQWNSGQAQYTIGNPTCTSIGEPPFTGTLTANSNVITNVTNLPTDLVAGTALSGNSAGSTLTDSQNIIPAGTYVTAIGTNTVTMSAVAIANSSGTDQITYTIPGDFAIPRPLRISYAFTRYSQLDFELDVRASLEEFNSILFKAQPGPWPTLGWYNNLMPYGVLNVYQLPSNGGELHLFTDTLLESLTATQVFILPPGYSAAIKWNLALQLWPEYMGPIPVPSQLAKNADQAYKAIQSLNAKPAPESRYDRELLAGDRPDGGWITHGGYGR